MSSRRDWETIKPMSRRDPTLSPENELKLVERVKTAHDSEALTTLINQHTGIYHMVVNKYAATYPHVINAGEMSDDKMLNIYQFVMAYKPDKNMALGTYIGSRTDWLCRSMLKTENRNPLTMVAANTLDSEEEEQIVTIPDTSFDAQVTEVAHRDLAIDEIVKESSITGDAQFNRILSMRNSSMSWRAIGKEIGISHEWARKIYNENILKLKSHLNPTT